MKKISLRPAILAGLLALALFTPLDARAEPAAAEVKIDNFTFAPQRLTIRPGTTVTWINEDDIPHTVAATGKEFRRCWTPTTNFRLRSRQPAVSNTFAPYTRI
jgi:plastocyanin